MKIAVYGGAFDPPHKSHILMAAAVAEYFDAVWLMPCYAHRFGKKTASAKDRIKFCQLSVYDYDKLFVSDFEIQNKLSNGTLDSLTQLSEAFPKHEFSFAIGQDNADQFHKWLNYETLLERFPAVVVPRSGFDCDALKMGEWYNQAPHRLLHSLKIPPISSTDIRNQIKDGTITVESFANQAVYDAVMASECYKD